MQGYIKLFRQITENEYWFSERFTKAQAWIDLLLLANHKPNTIYIRGNEVKTKPGELCYSEITLAKRWRWNRKTVDKFLLSLQKREMLDIRKTRLTTIISIKNWYLYQVDGQQKGQQKDNRTDINKNVKEELITLSLSLVNEVKNEKSLYSLLNKYKSALGQEKLFQILSGCYSRKTSFATEKNLAAYLETCKRGNGKITDNLPEINGVEKWMQ